MSRQQLCEEVGEEKSGLQDIEAKEDPSLNFRALDAVAQEPRFSA